MTRTSVVGSVYVLVVIFDSVVQCGDTRYIQAKTDVFAIQRERPEFQVNELPLEQYPVFRRPIPQLSPQEDVRMFKRDVVPTITVGAVKVLAISTSGIVQIGSNVCIELESRIKHGRQFLPRPSGEAAAPTAVAPGAAASVGALVPQAAGH